MLFRAGRLLRADIPLDQEREPRLCLCECCIIVAADTNVAVYVTVDLCVSATTCAHLEINFHLATEEEAGTKR